jgi:hypothetical protein
MTKLPKVLGLLLCKRMGIDVATGEMSLVGLLRTLVFHQWPAHAEPFLAYTLLYDGVGEGRMVLTATRLETEEDIYRNRRWVAFPGRGLSSHTEIPIRQCIFPAPGRYLFTLRFEGEVLAQQFLDVRSE